MGHSPLDFQGTDRFVIRRRLGAGSMGVVYEAYDRKRGEIIALKTLKQTEASSILRFKREFRALADVSHPNVVSLYELLVEGDSWFFTMELVRGTNFLDYVYEADFESLASPEDVPTVIGPEEQKLWNASMVLMSRRPAVNFDRLRRTLRQLAEGVAALHDAKKLHRDIKPSNVLVTPEGRLVLLDFGLVKEFSLPALDESASFVGTPAYMSPEQGAGLPVSEASDWYSVGVMLYQALTGRLPFAGQRVLEVVTRKLQFSAAAPADLVNGIPEDLDVLCRQLLRTEPSDRPSGPEVLRAVAPFPTTAHVRLPMVPARTAPFIGRESHLAKLSNALSSVKEGKAVTVCVHGSSGLGKTTLIRRFLEEVQQRDASVVVLQGRCFEQESVPYKALDSLMDALSQYLKRISSREAEALMPRDCAALARLFPVLQQVDAVTSGRRRVLEVPDSQELRRRAFAALRELLSRLTDRWPVILFVDDLQWGDVDSAALIAELLRPPDAPALLFIASYRTEEAQTSPLLKTLLASLASFNSIDLRGILVAELVPGEARNLALALLDRDKADAATQAAAIARESGGSPLFIAELARHIEESRAEALSSPAPTAEITLDEMIHGRVNRLPNDARRLLEVVAVAGQPLELRIAKRAAGSLSDEHQVLGILRSSHLIRTREGHDGDEIETYHDRIRETVRERIAPEQLKSYHMHLASALEHSGNGDPETLAVHYLGAGDPDKAAHHAAEAADRAAEAFAFDRAARLYQDALRLWPARDMKDSTVRIKLGDALTKAGRGAEAAAAYLEASQKAGAVEAVELRRQAAEQLLRSGHIDEGLSILHTVLQSMGLRLAQTPTRALMSLLSRRIHARLRGTKFHERDASQIPAEELMRIDACWSVGIGLSMVDVIRGADFQALHLLLALKAGEPARVARAFASEAPYVATVGVRASRRAGKLLHEAEALAERIRQPDALGRAKLAAGITAYLTGRWKQAVQSTSSAEEILREQCTGVAWERNTAHHFLLMSCICLGEWREIGERLATLLKEAEERGDLLAEANLGIRMSYLLLLAADDVEGAREQCREGLMSWSQQGFHTQHYYDLLRQGEIALYAGMPESGWEFIRSRWQPLHRSLILRIQVFRIEVLHLRARVALAAAQASIQSVASHFLRAADADARRLARQRTVWAHGLSQLIRAGIFNIRGRTSEALDLLASAEEAFVATDMGLYAAAARRRRGQIIGAGEGRILVRSSDDWIESQKIKNPERITSMLAPGFAGRGD